MASKHHIEGKIPSANYIATISLTRPCISLKWWVLQGARLVLIEVFNASLKASESGWRLSLCLNYSSSVSSLLFLKNVNGVPLHRHWIMWAWSKILWSTLRLQWRREWVSTGLTECISILIINTNIKINNSYFFLNSSPSVLRLFSLFVCLLSFFIIFVPLRIDAFTRIKNSLFCLPAWVAF